MATSCRARSSGPRSWSGRLGWPSRPGFLPGELSQVLPTPAPFEQASQLVSRDMVAGTMPCGPDPERHLSSLREYVDAGYDEVYVQQIGPEQDAFFDAWAEHVLPVARRELVNA